MPGLAQAALLLGASLAAGALNAAAGGGTLLTFPSLLGVGFTALDANATSTVALATGSFSAFRAFRRATPGVGEQARWLVAPCLLGGGLGAWLVMRVGGSTFSRVVPWLVLSATLLFLFQEPLRRWTRPPAAPSPEAPVSPPGMARAVLVAFPVAVYGGFFGAGMGILLLAVFGWAGERDLQRMNAWKNLAATCVNSVSSAVFLLSGHVHLAVAALMAVGAITGGTLGAGLARRIGAARLRLFIGAVGLTLGALLLRKHG